ncbi:hypothetical protein [Terricaulis sp.]|uniref:hypothetical protein n=1 Tax=Terricaulis sp. TaxID=2768686 RepID=UPI00378484F2
MNEIRSQFDDILKQVQDDRDDATARWEKCESESNRSRIVALFLLGLSSFLSGFSLSISPGFWDFVAFLASILANGWISFEFYRGANKRGNAAQREHYALDALMRKAEARWTTRVKPLSGDPQQDAALAIVEWVADERARLNTEFEDQGATT